MTVAIFASAAIFKYTYFGRNIFAIGSNCDAARLSGISVRKTIYGVYVSSGVLCALGGILLTSRLASGIPTLGTGYEMNAIAAAVVGGASMSGGVGYNWWYGCRCDSDCNHQKWRYFVES